MNRYWPLNFDLNDTSSVLDILEEANKEWAEKSNGLLSLVLQAVHSSDGDDMVIVHCKHTPSGRTASILSVVHRPGAPYPASIFIKGSNLPNYLKKNYTKPGFSGLKSLSGALSVDPEVVTNNWVCDTPAEFRTKLEKAFNTGNVKSDVLSLIAGGNVPKPDEGTIEQLSSDESVETEN